MSSHILRLTRHRQAHTPPQHTPCSNRSFFAFSWACCATLPSHIPRIPSCHQYNVMCYLHSFAGKTHQVKSRPRWMVYFDMHPERRRIHLTRDEDIGPVRTGSRRHRSPPATATDGAYSSGPIAPTSPKRALAKLMTEHLRLERAAASLSRPRCRR